MNFSQEQINAMYQKAAEMYKLSSKALQSITGAEIRYNKNPSEKNLLKLNELKELQEKLFNEWHEYQNGLPKVKFYVSK